MPGRRSGPVPALAAALIGALLVLATAPTGAQSAGPELVSSAPAADAVLRDGPDTVRLTFDQPVSARSSGLWVVDPDGEVVVGGARAAGARALRFDLPAPLGPGRHLLGWRAVGSDGPAAGAFVVTVDPTGVGATSVDRSVAAAPGRSAAWRAAVVALAAVLAAAALLLAEAVSGRRLRAAVVVGVLLGAGLVALVALGLAGVDADGSVADLLGVDAWTGAAADSTGRRWLLALLVLAVVPAALLADPARRSGRSARAGVALLLVAGAGAATWSAHDAQAVEAGPTVSAETAVAGGRVVVTLEPGHTGVNEAHVYGFGPDGSTIDLADGALAFTHRPTGIGPLVVGTVPVAPGHLIAPTVDLPLAGVWEVEVASGTLSGTVLTLEVPA